MFIVILFLVTLWAIACVIRLLCKWLPPGEEVHRPPRGYPANYEQLLRVGMAVSGFL